MSVHPALVELVFVLRESDVVQPTCETKQPRHKVPGVLSSHPLIFIHTSDPDEIELCRLFGLLADDCLDG